MNAKPLQTCVHCGEFVYAVVGGGWAHLGRWWRPRRCRAAPTATPDGSGTVNDLAAPAGYEWVEVGAFCERSVGSRPGWTQRSVLIDPHESGGWGDGYLFGAVCRGDDPLGPRRCAWERMYVLRPVSPKEQP